MSRLAVAPETYVGQQLEGAYQVGRLIGLGGFAAVYVAKAHDGTPVAVKIGLSDVPQALRRFTREIKVMQSMPPSPHIVRYLDKGCTDDGRPFFAMEYVRGPTLSQGLRARPVLSGDEAAVVLFQVCRALQALHSYGIVHRDVKPSNVLLSPDGLVKLFDFGLVLDSEGMLRLFEEEDILSGTDFADDIEKGAIAGTPEYMAPEQFEDPLSMTGEPRRTAPAADVFSAGIILYRLVTGNLPYPMRERKRSKSSKDMMAYLHQRNRAIEKGLRKPPRIEQSLWSILVRAISTDPADRQPDSKALADDFFGYMTEGKGAKTWIDAPTQVGPRPPMATPPPESPTPITMENLFAFDEKTEVDRSDID